MHIVINLENVTDEIKERRNVLQIFVEEDVKLNLEKAKGAPFTPIPKRRKQPRLPAHANP